MNELIIGGLLVAIGLLYATLVRIVDNVEEYLKVNLETQRLVKEGIKQSNADARDIKRRMKFEMKRTKKVVKATKKK